ncbi:MAG TPA: hypothetical protein VHN80_23330, partial [Kineosporiaceae bacterium]|nr:hypothetical protein [Kineosporiaceae bacterium]
RQIITTLADRYQRHGYRQVAVPAGAFLSMAGREELEHALAELLDDGHLVAFGTNGVSLHPSARLALLSRTVLDQWLEKVSRDTGHTFGMHRDAIAAELRTLTGWASAATLPDELAQRAAELAGVSATREMDPRAMDLVARHGGTPQSRLAALAAMPPGSCATVDQLLTHLRHSVSTVY